VTRVVHVSVVHKPDDPRIYERECRSLAEAGYEVCYLAPGAPSTRDRYGVLTLPLPERPRSRRWLDAREVLAAVRALRPKVVHVHDPELLTLLPALRRSVPRLVYDMHEYVPEQVATKHYIPAAVRPHAARAATLAQRNLAAFAAGVITVTEQQFEALGEKPRLRLSLPNYPRVERFTDVEPLPDLAADPRLKIAYIGSLRRDRGCALMLDVMEQLDADEAVLYLGGVFADPAMEDETRQRLAAGLHDRVKLLGRVPPAELPRYLTAADVVWSPSLSGPQYSLPTVDTKIFEGMAGGLAVLATNLPGRGEIVRLEECGLVVPSGIEGHLRGVRRMLANRAEVVDMGIRGRAAVERRYSWEALASDLVCFYGSLCAGLPSATGSRDDQGVTTP
jgi:glycosyltransferase involved in cell wall biosynthesis